MRFLTLPALLVAALFSAVAVVPFLPLAQTATNLFALEVRLSSSATGVVKLYHDRGAGYNESDVSQASIAAGAAATVRLALPPGSYRAFRFDPIDRAGTVTIESLRVTGQGGRVVGELDFAS